MRTIFFSLVLAVVAQDAICQADKYNYNLKEPSFESNLILNCDNDSTGLIPLQDLGSGFYLSYMGGLYINGSNAIPTAHLNKGKKISKAIKKLDTLGNVDLENGKIVMVGMGASVASDAYNSFQDSLMVANWAGTNLCLDIRSVFIGGKVMEDMVDYNSDYWMKFLDRLAAKGLHPEEVQIVWMLLQSDEDTADVAAYLSIVEQEYKDVLQNMLAYMPNLVEVFISGLHYTGYTHESHERYKYLIEPKGYLGNLAIRELIVHQIKGDTDLIYSGINKKVPFILWGPNFWADGKNPRLSDGLTWTCEEFRDDSIGGGFHLKPEYRHKEGELLQDFFSTNPVTSIWFNDGARWAACKAAKADNVVLLPAAKNVLQVYPNPVTSMLHVEIPIAIKENCELLIHDLNGKIIYNELLDPEINYEKQIPTLTWPAGIYLIQIRTATLLYDTKFIKI